MAHPFHSSTTTMKAFNHQKYTKLKKQSRFGGNVNTPKFDISRFNLDNHDGLEAKTYDIIGNTFKTSLIPISTVGDMLTQSSRENTPCKKTKYLSP